tara:strand:- start:97 stop:423 length:327 start_codon:yes stop_codon:yes gene_type:complete
MKNREITLTVDKIKSISEDGGCISIKVDENYVIESILQQAVSELKWSKDHWGDTLKSRLWNTINNRWNGMLVGHAEYIDKMVDDKENKGYTDKMHAIADNKENKGKDK